jgi:hypothetical protein
MDESEVLGRSLLVAFERVPDPRARSGRRQPLPAILALSTAARLAGARSLYAMAQWGRLQPPAVGRALGFTRPGTPCVATYTCCSGAWTRRRSKRRWPRGRSRVWGLAG